MQDGSMMNGIHSDDLVETRPRLTREATEWSTFPPGEPILDRSAGEGLADARLHMAAPIYAVDRQRPGLLTPMASR
jgi:hypothetical protein